MSLSSGSRLGPYEICARIGAGGMGEVFHARDTKLNRDVAIKVLPADIADDPERLARFRREAQVLASLNHPHVGSIHGLEESNGSPFLVLELVDGEDLSARLSRGAIPFDEALAIALQIAEALEAAHEKGIVHRDLKPANVKVTSEGVVKLLDFGLAKASAASTSGPAPDLSFSPTLTAHGTQAGVILGTAAYMSPEQARGRPVDKRADVWAFGVVLYEMLTGRRLFQGETVSDILASVLKNEPDLDALGDVPPRVRRVLARCLQKDPRQRLHDIGDARLELLEKELPSAPAPAARVPAGMLSRAAPWAVAVVAVAASAVLALTAARRGAPRAMPLRLSVLPPAAALSSGPIELSPDGTKLAFTASGPDGKTLLYWRSLDTPDARPLNGTEGANAPFWSPDGGSIGFFAGKKLKRIAIAGGPPRELAEITDDRGGSWGSQGVIVYAADGGGPIYRIRAEGGTPVAVTKLDAGRQETSHRWPHFLPDGKRFLFLSRRPKPPARLMIEAASIDGGRRVPITEAMTSGVLRGGRLYFGRESALFWQPIDERTLTLSGEPRAITDALWGSPAEMDGLTAFSVAEDGTLAYRVGGVSRFQLTWRDREGRKLGTVGTASNSANPSVSRDLSRVFEDITYDIAKSIAALYSIDTETGRQTRITFSAGNDTKPVLSPDGRTIAFASDALGPFDLYLEEASGGVARPLVVNGSWKYADSWSGDGRYLSYTQVESTTKGDIWVLPFSGDKKPFPFVATAADEGSSVFSPDGRFVAYDSDEAGGREVFIQPFPANGTKWQASISGGGSPCWRADGRELFYLSAENRLTSVPITVSVSGLSVGTPRPLFQTTLRPLSTGRQYDASPDGQRFLLNEPVGTETSSPILLVIPGLEKAR